MDDETTNDSATGKRVMVELDPQLHTDFKIKCTEYNTTMSTMIAGWVKEWVEGKLPPRKMKNGWGKK